MKIQRGFKTELNPNNRERANLLRHAGAARFAYNWGLQQKIEAHRRGEKAPTAIDLSRKLNALKKTDYPWLYETSKCAPQEALRNLDSAYAHFFRRCQAKKQAPGFPRFKSRKRGVGSFTLSGSIRVFNGSLQLPRIGEVRLKERGYLPENGWKILRATVSARAGRWFISLQVEREVPDPKPKEGEILGLDVGVNHLAVLSDGTAFENPKALSRSQDRLRMLNKQLHRRKKGGKNRRKTARRLARQHFRIACVRKDAVHKATSAIARRASVVGIESLDVAEMLRNRCLAQVVMDAGLSELHRQLRYKMAWLGGSVVEVGRWFPSSKQCSCCGHILQELPLSVRQWACPGCGSEHDRDRNAAINLQKMAVSSTVTACRQGSAGQAKRSGGTTSWAGTKRRVGER